MEINNGRKKIQRLRLPRRWSQSYRNKAGFYLHKRPGGTDKKIKAAGSGGKYDGFCLYIPACEHNEKRRNNRHLIIILLIKKRLFIFIKWRNFANKT